MGRNVRCQGKGGATGLLSGLALLADGALADHATARKLADELLQAHKANLSQFA